MTILAAVGTWYFLSALSWMLLAVVHRRKRLIDYLWCLLWPIGLVLHG